MDFAGMAVTAKHVLSFYSRGRRGKQAAVRHRQESCQFFLPMFFLKYTTTNTKTMKQIRLSVLMILLFLSMLFTQDWAESITTFIGAISSLLVALALLIMCLILAVTWYNEGKLPGSLYRDENDRA
ncbi:MAG: hypothetical protein MJY60_04080 [Bacteroidales bacterium]|nr:hypothetical protein [Bacteroidales bacterium]